MKHPIKQLQKLGMSPKKSMLFLRSIAESWFHEGRRTKEIPFDTLFSKELAKTTIKK